MIAIDWGTSNFRAYRLLDAQIIGRIPTGPGLLSVPPGQFPATLKAAIEPWLQAGESRILLAGMVGSRQGWIEAPYLPCPAGLEALAGATVPVPFEHAQARLVPGLSAQDPAGIPEVMRGEEVQLAGILHRTAPDAAICLPGTHSKWVQLQAGQIAGFTTHMTGEVFAALRAHTILGRLMQDGPTLPEPFARGVARAREPGGLLHHLFGVRALGLFGRLPETEAASFLSGILIGHEIHAAAPAGLVHLVGAPALCTLYSAAIQQYGAHAIIEDEDAAAHGLARIGHHVAWT